MAENTLKTEYELSLSIKNGDKVKSTIAEMDTSLKAMSKSTKAMDFKSAEKTAQKLADQIHKMATGTEDCTEEMKAFDKASSKAYKDLESAAVKLNHSLSEQGQQQRARIKELEAEKAALDKTVEGKKRAREIDKELKDLKRDVVVASDDELKSMLQSNVRARARLKLAQQEAKLSKAEVKEQKALQKMGKDEIKTLKEKVNLQQKYVKELKNTESRWSSIKRVMGKIGGGLKTVGKIGGGIVGGAMMLTGAASDAANFQVDRAREANRIRAALTPEQKENLLSELYIDTGADAATIVDAINRVVSVLGPRAKQHEISRAVEAEIRYPGAAAMFKQQTTGPVSANDFAIYQNRMRAIQGVTGATQDQVLESTQKIANLKQKYFSNASMTELQSVYLGLQGSGAFDTQEELDRAFDAFVKKQANSNKSVYDALYEFDWKKYADTDTNRTQIENTIRNLQWGALDKAAHTTSTDQQFTQAEETASKLRQLEETKNKLLIKVMEALAPVIDKIKPETISRFFESSMRLVLKITPLIEKIVEKISDTLDTADDIMESVENGNYKEAAAKGFLAIPGMSGLVSLLVNHFAKDDKNPNGYANGGIASVPSICGEAGPEAVIPLDPARSGRASQIMSYVTNNFSMSGSETTAMSLSNALSSREFAFQSGRIWALQHRLGRG